MTLYEQASTFHGLTERPGPGSNPEILEMIKSMFPNAVDDSEVAWCSIFINYVAKLAGYERSGSGMARSWETVGTPIPDIGRMIGDVVVFWRGSKTSGKGHVGLYVNDTRDGRIRVLGGNQSDSVNIRIMGWGKVVCFRRLNKV